MIFLTGGTGQVGGELLRQLIAEGAEVRVLIRDEQVAPGLRERGVDVVVGDLAEPDPLVKAMRGCDHAFLLLPGSPDQVELFEWYRQGNAEVVSGDVERVLGRPATTYADWGREHADAFR